MRDESQLIKNASPCDIDLVLKRRSHSSDNKLNILIGRYTCSQLAYHCFLSHRLQGIVYNFGDYLEGPCDLVSHLSSLGNGYAKQVTSVYMFIPF